MQKYLHIIMHAWPIISFISKLWRIKGFLTFFKYSEATKKIKKLKWRPRFTYDEENMNISCIFQKLKACMRNEVVKCYDHNNYLIQTWNNKNEAVPWMKEVLFDDSELAKISGLIRKRLGLTCGNAANILQSGMLFR